MAVPFLESKLYLKLFPLERIFDDLCAQATDLWIQNDIPSCRNAERIDVVSIGFGMGARDVAVMLGLATALGAEGPSIHVLAIDPAVDQVGIAQDRSFLLRSGFAVSPNDPNVWIRSRDAKRAAIQIELTNLTAERWLKAKRLECAPRWDIVLACAVIHLLVDWKDTLGQFLSDLRPQGVLVFAEATGTVGVFEGDFRCGVSENDPWEMLWHTVSQVREDLLIPAAKRVAPGNMSFLYQVLGDLGYERLQRSHREPFIDAQCDQETTVAEVIELIESVVGGPHAKTLGALRILDVERAAEFVRCVREKLSPPAFRPEQKLFFRTGTRLHALRKPVAAASQHFTVAVARSALLRAQGEASELKAAIKESLGEVRRETGYARGETTPLRSEQAIAALLYDMREILALSRDTLMVIARRNGKRYTEAFQVPPASLLGANSEEAPEKYIRSMTVYTAADASNHLSQLLDEEGIGDITVRIDICPDAEIEDGRRVALDAQYAVNGSPSSLYLRLSESIVRTAKASVQANPLFVSGSASKYFERYEGCARDGSFTRFYLTPDINGLRRLMRGENGDVVSPDVSVDSPTDIKKVIEDRVDVLFAVPPHLSPEHLSWRKKLKSRLPSLLFHTLRLSWVEWRRAEDDLPPWRTCFYFARKNAHRTEERLGVGLLLLLPKSDRQAWAEGGFSEAPCGFGARPLLANAAEPFLAAIQEIRVSELAASSAMQSFSAVLGHELSKVYAGAIDVRRAVCLQASSADPKCVFAGNVTDAALNGGMLWFNYKGMIGKDLIPPDAYPLDASLQGASWKAYADAVASFAWRVFLGGHVVYQNAEELLDVARDVNTLWTANLSRVVKVSPSDNLRWCPGPITERTGDRERFTVAIIRWFTAALVNAWKHSIDKTLTDQEAKIRVNLVKRYLEHPDGSGVTMKAVPGDGWTSFAVENNYRTLDCGVASPGKRKEQGTELALDLAADEVGASLDARDRILCKFDRTISGTWSAELHIPFVMMETL